MLVLKESHHNTSNNIPLLNSLLEEFKGITLEELLTRFPYLINIQHKIDFVLRSKIHNLPQDESKG